MNSDYLLVLQRAEVMACPVHGSTTHRNLEGKMVCIKCLAESIKRNAECLR